MIAEPLHQSGPGVPSAPPFDVEAAMKVAAFHARRLARTIGTGAADAEDFRQGLLLEAWRRWPRFDSRISSAATFLNAVMSNATASMRRSLRARKRGAATSFIPIQSIEANGQATCSLECPTGSILRSDLDTVLSGLAPGDRAMCALVAQRPIRKAAELLGISRNTVTQRLRALRPAFASLATAGGPCPSQNAVAQGADLPRVVSRRSRP